MMLRLKQTCDLMTESLAVLCCAQAYAAVRCWAVLCRAVARGWPSNVTHNCFLVKLANENYEKKEKYEKKKGEGREKQRVVSCMFC
jgi:hypothetical protein